MTISFGQHPQHTNQHLTRAINSGPEFHWGVRIQPSDSRYPIPSSPPESQSGNKDSFVPLHPNRATELEIIVQPDILSSPFHSVLNIPQTVREETPDSSKISNKKRTSLLPSRSSSSARRSLLKTHPYQGKKLIKRTKPGNGSSVSKKTKKEESILLVLPAQQSDLVPLNATLAKNGRPTSDSGSSWHSGKSTLMERPVSTSHVSIGFNPFSEEKNKTLSQLDSVFVREMVAKQSPGAAALLEAITQLFHGDDKRQRKLLDRASNPPSSPFSRS